MHIAWLDLETTHLDERVGCIVEVGVIVTDERLDPLTTYETLVAPIGERASLTMDHEVRAIHERSGLLGDLQNAGGLGWLRTITDVEQEVCDLLDAWRTAEQPRLALAGSGVSHFDRRWLRAHMPRVERRMTYWSLDVGVVRRFVAQVDPALVRPTPAGKAHRALADARDALDEWRYYRAMFGRAADVLHDAALDRNLDT